MRDYFSHYALLAGILFFVGRLHVFPSLGDALIAGLFATASVAVALLAWDAVFAPDIVSAPHSPADSSAHGHQA